MEQQKENEDVKDTVSGWFDRRNSPVLILFVLLGLMLGIGVSSLDKLVIWQKIIFGNKIESNTSVAEDTTALEASVLPSEGFELPVAWKDYGKQLSDKGVIDQQKFEALYSKRGGLSEEERKLLSGADNGKLKITSENSAVILNLLWAFGLGNKNQILEKGPMTDKNYGGAERFASTGGWTLSKDKAMNYYSKYAFVTLTDEQQAAVERVSQNIYRPCCNNSTYFPDCNHGMAMLGLLELLASQGVLEDEMYRVALEVNSFWFPQTYLTLAKYFKEKGVDWKNTDAKLLLSKEYSSSSGYKQVLTEINPVEQNRGGGSCGV